MLTNRVGKGQLTVETGPKFDCGDADGYSEQAHWRQVGRSLVFTQQWVAAGGKSGLQGQGAG
jgi:hypothetical protein